MFDMFTHLFLALRSRVAGLHEERGATAVEYGIMVALIAAVIVGIVGTLGGQVQDAFQTVSTALN